MCLLNKWTTPTLGLFFLCFLIWPSRATCLQIWVFSICTWDLIPLALPSRLLEIIQDGEKELKTKWGDRRVCSTPQCPAGPHLAFCPQELAWSTWQRTSEGTGLHSRPEAMTESAFRFFYEPVSFPSLGRFGSHIGQRRCCRYHENACIASTELLVSEHRLWSRCGPRWWGYCGLR